MAALALSGSRRRSVVKITSPIFEIPFRGVVEPAAFRLLGRAGRKGLILSVCRAYSAFKKPHGKKSAPEEARE